MSGFTKVAIIMPTTESNGEILTIKQVADYPARHASTMVALEATLDAVNQALAKHHSDTRTRLAGAA